MPASKTLVIFCLHASIISASLCLLACKISLSCFVFSLKNLKCFTVSMHLKPVLSYCFFHLLKALSPKIYISLIVSPAFKIFLLSYYISGLYNIFVNVPMPLQFLLVLLSLHASKILVSYCFFCLLISISVLLCLSAPNSSALFPAASTISMSHSFLPITSTSLSYYPLSLNFFHLVAVLFASKLCYAVSMPLKSA